MRRAADSDDDRKRILSLIMKTFPRPPRVSTRMVTISMWQRTESWHYKLSTIGRLTW